MSVLDEHGPAAAFDRVLRIISHLGESHRTALDACRTLTEELAQLKAILEPRLEATLTECPGPCGGDGVVGGLIDGHESWDEPCGLCAGEGVIPAAEAERWAQLDAQDSLNNWQAELDEVPEVTLSRDDEYRLHREDIRDARDCSAETEVASIERSWAAEAAKAAAERAAHPDDGDCIFCGSPGDHGLCRNHWDRIHTGDWGEW